MENFFVSLPYELLFRLSTEYLSLDDLFCLNQVSSDLRNLFWLNEEGWKSRYLRELSSHLPNRSYREIYLMARRRLSKHPSGRKDLRIILKYRLDRLLTKYYCFSTDTPLYRYALATVAKYGQVDMMEYLASLHRSSNSRIQQEIQETLFVAAARGGHLDLVKQYYQASKLDLAFENAVERNRIACIKFLLEQGAHQFTWGMAAAARGGHLSLVHEMKQRGANNLDECLFEACSFGQVEIVKTMVGWGARDFTNALIKTIRSGHVNLLEYFRQLNVFPIDSCYLEFTLEHSIELTDCVALVLLMIQIYPPLRNKCLLWAIKYKRIKLVSTLFDPTLDRKNMMLLKTALKTKCPEIVMLIIPSFCLDQKDLPVLKMALKTFCLEIIVIVLQYFSLTPGETSTLIKNINLKDYPEIVDALYARTTRSD